MMSCTPLPKKTIAFKNLEAAVDFFSYINTIQYPGTKQDMAVQLEPSGNSRTHHASGDGSPFVQVGQDELLNLVIPWDELDDLKPMQQTHVLLGVCSIGL